MPSRNTTIANEWPIVVVALEDLLLDEHNPRTKDSLLNQPDPLLRMMNLHGQSVIDLLRDIASRGSLSPFEQMIAIESGRKYTVLEGNRRLTCLKLWKNPSLLDSDEQLSNQYKRQIELAVASSSHTPLESVKLSVAPSKSEARPWISLKHESGQGGRSTVQWTPFMKEQAITESHPERRPVTLAFVEFIYDFFNEDTELLDALKGSMKKYSNLQRVIKKSAARERLGFNFSQGEITPLYENQHLRPIYFKLLSDLALPKHPDGRPWSRVHHSNGDVLVYFEEFKTLWPSEIGSPLDNPTPVRPKGSSESTDKSDSENLAPNTSESLSINSSQANNDAGQTSLFETEPKPTPKDKRTTRKKTPAQDLHIFEEVHLSEFPPRLQNLVDEVVNLDATRFPEVGAAILRVVLDLTFEHFENSVGIDKGNNQIWTRAKKIIEHINPAAASSSSKVQTWPELKELWNRCTDDNMKVIQLGVHSFNMPNLSSEVVALARRFEPLLVSMNDYLGQSKDS